MKVLSLEKKLLMNIFKAFKYREQILFIVCGGIAASINFFSRILLSFYLNLTLSVFFAYILGMLTAYFLFKKFVFLKNKKSKKSSPIFFIVVNFIAVLHIYLMTVLINYVAQSYMGYSNVTIAHGISLSTSVFLSYYLHKNYTYK